MGEDLVDTMRGYLQYWGLMSSKNAAQNLAVPTNPRLQVSRQHANDLEDKTEQVNSKRIITPLDEDYRLGMMTWSILQYYGIVRSDDAANKLVSAKIEAEERRITDAEATERGAPTKAQKEAFKCALAVALKSSVISEDQVTCLWEASNPLRAKDVARIASKALISSKSHVMMDKEGAADNFAHMLTMLLAGNSVEHSQIRMLVECTHELTSDTIHNIMVQKLSAAYNKKEMKKQRKEAEEKLFREKFKEVLSFVIPPENDLNNAPVAISVEAFEKIVEASSTLKPGEADDIMQSLGISWDDLRRQCTQSTKSPSITVSRIAPHQHERMRAAEAFGIAASLASADRHEEALAHYTSAIEDLMILLQTVESSEYGELANYINHYINEAEHVKKCIASELFDEQKHDNIDNSISPKKIPPPPPPPPSKRAAVKEISNDRKLFQPPPPPPPPKKMETTSIDMATSSHGKIPAMSDDLSAKNDKVSANDPTYSDSYNEQNRISFPPPPPPLPRPDTAEDQSNFFTIESKSQLTPPSSGFPDDFLVSQSSISLNETQPTLPPPPSRLPNDFLASIRENSVSLNETQPIPPPPPPRLPSDSLASIRENSVSLNETQRIPPQSGLPNDFLASIRENSVNLKEVNATIRNVEAPCPKPHDAPRPSVDLLASIRDKSIILRKAPEQEKKKVEDGNSLMNQLSGMIDQRRAFIGDSSDSDDNSDFDD